MLLSWLPQDLTGRRVLDAGCGTGALAFEAARRGADVVGIDVSPQLIAIADERTPAELRGRLRFLAGDMLDPALGQFDHIVSMDVLIHYEADQIATAAAGLAERASQSLVFTFAPGTPLLRTARAIGQFFPKSDRSPTIIPVGHDYLRARMSRSLPKARLGRDQRVSRRFLHQPCAGGADGMSRGTRLWKTVGSAVPALRRCGDDRTAAVAAAAAVAVPGVGRPGDGAAQRHAQPGDDRRTEDFGDRRCDSGRAAAAVRAAARADRPQIRSSPLVPWLEAGALSVVRHAVAVLGARDHAVRAAGDDRRRRFRPHPARAKSAAPWPSCSSAPEWR